MTGATSFFAGLYELSGRYGASQRERRCVQVCTHSAVVNHKKIFGVMLVSSKSHVGIFGARSRVPFYENFGDSASRGYIL